MQGIHGCGHRPGRSTAEAARCASGGRPALDLVTSARIALRDGRSGAAEVAGTRIGLRAVTVTGGEIVALATDGAELPGLSGCDDVPGELRLEGRGAPDRTARVEVRVLGWWRQLGSVEVMTGAPQIPADLMAALPYEALATPGAWASDAPLFTLEPAAATVRELAPGRTAAPSISFDDESVRCLLD